MRGLHLNMSWVVSLALSVAVARGAIAESPSLVQARQAYEDLEYDKVAPLLQEALGEASGPDEEVEIFELLATMHVTYNRDAKARAAFVELLRRRGDYALPTNSSPKIRQVFKAAHAEFEEEQAALVPAPEPDDHSAPEEIAPAKPVEEPALAPELQETGSAASPVSSPPIEEGSLDPSTPVHETWWFWTGVGTLGAAAVLGGGSYLLWNLTQPVVPESDFGPYQLK